MQYAVHFDNPPAGYSLHAARDGEPIQVQYREFTSTEDGQHFIERLEGFPSEVLALLPSEHAIRPSQVETMLVVLQKDGSAMVYVNEPQFTATMRPAWAINKGDDVTKDNIIDIAEVDVGVEIPAAAGFMHLFSSGWRKGMFFDFGPLGPNPQPRDYSVPATLGWAYSQVLFQDRYRITDAEWEHMLKTQWFPFAALRNDTISKLISYVRIGWSPDEVLTQIIHDVENRLSDMLAAWQGHPSFAAHTPFLEAAVERFRARDFISCTSILFPRIEGILRSQHGVCGAGQANLSRTAVILVLAREDCLLLPKWFEKYLREVYFASFDPADPHVCVSRNSVAHGVAHVDEYNEKSAVIGFLVVQQLYYCLDAKHPQSVTSSSPSPT